MINRAPKVKAFLGRAIVDGRVRFLATTTLEKADPESGGCLRRWHYRYVCMQQEPKSKAQEAGTAMHADIARYYTTGEMRLGPLAATGMHLFLPPGPDLLIEHPIAPIEVPYPEYADRATLPPEQQSDEERVGRSANLASVEIGLAAAPLRAAGIPIIGDVDLSHRRGINKGAENIEDIVDPPGTIEVMDWKSTSDPKWMKTGPDLPRTIQMSGYGEWAHRVTGHAGDVRLSHGYFFTKKTAPARKVTILVNRETIARSWAHAEVVAGNIAAAATVADPDQIPANLAACNAYGGCPHKKSGICKAGMNSSLDLFLGRTGAESIKLPILNNAPTEIRMGIMDMIAKPAAAPTTNTAPAPTAEELVAQKRAAAIAALPPGFPEALGAIKAQNLGKPMMRLAATDGIIAVTGIAATPGASLLGVGTLGKLTLDTPEQVVELAQILTDPARAGDRAALLGSLEQAPAPEPQPTVSVGVIAPMPAAQIRMLPPDAPESHPALAMNVAPDAEPVPVVEGAPAEDDAPVVPPGSIAAVTQEKAKGTRKKRTDPAGTDGNPAATPAPTAPASTPPATEQQPTPPAQTSAARGVRLYVNCYPRSGGQDFTPYVREWCRLLATKCPDERGKALADIRMAEQPNALAFGKWKGALGALAAECLPAIPPGDYLVDTRGDELVEIAVLAIKTLVSEYVRGAL